MKRTRLRYGFSLVELVVALTLAGGLLAASWGWAWTVVACTHRVTESCEAASSLAFARRLIMADLRSCSGLAAPPVEPGCSAVTLALLTDSGGVCRYGFDPARAILWRGSPSSYVAEGVRTLSISYFDAAGQVMSVRDAPLSAAAASLVRRVAITIGCNDEPSTVRWAVSLR